MDETGLDSIAEGYKPVLVYILVLKRHTTRFFPPPEGVDIPELLDSQENTRPGLSVRDILTRRHDLPTHGYFLNPIKL